MFLLVREFFKNIFKIYFLKKKIIETTTYVIDSDQTGFIHQIRNLGYKFHLF